MSLTAEGFVRDAQHSASSFGLPGLPIAVMPVPFTNQSRTSIDQMVDELIPEVIAGLTRPVTKTAVSEVVTVDAEWLTFKGEDLLDALDAMNTQFLEYGWSDGFPLRPPTEPEVDRMLSGTARQPEDVVAILEPGFGMATVRKIAANAVMAGCRPQHMPVIMAALECLAEPKMYLRNKAMSTGPHAPLIWVNGPMVKKINLNSGRCALGPGALSYANSVIGRAVRLCMMNLGHTYPGVSDSSPLSLSCRLRHHGEDEMRGGAQKEAVRRRNRGRVFLVPRACR